MRLPPAIRGVAHVMMRPFEEWVGRAKHNFFHKKTKDPNSTGVSARPDFHWLILLGSALSFAAGWVNAFTFLAANVGVSHVTGTVTKMGMGMASNDGPLVEVCIGLWLSFFVGGVFSGMIIVNESFAMGRSYGHAFLVIALFLFWASLWVVYAPENPSWIFLVSTACGIQNGVTTRYSGNVVRTTHMTGLTTDVGIVVGHILRCHPKAEKWKLKLYLPMLGFFIAGAAMCYHTYKRYRHYTIIFPTIFIFILGLGYIGMLSKVRHQPFGRILLHRVSDEVLTPHSPTSIRKRIFRQQSMKAAEQAAEKARDMLGSQEEDEEDGITARVDEILEKDFGGSVSGEAQDKEMQEQGGEGGEGLQEKQVELSIVIPPSAV